MPFLGLPADVRLLVYHCLCDGITLETSRNDDDQNQDETEKKYGFAGSLYKPAVITE